MVFRIMVRKKKFEGDDMIKIGEIVNGSHFPETVEIKLVESFGENYYSVAAIGRESHTYYERMLERHELESLTKVELENSNANELTPRDIQHLLQYYSFQIEERYSKGRSLGNKNLMPLPHQIEAVYSKMLQVPQTRFLLADDPGAGKTIMSGMLIKELSARESVKRILILVPPLVLKQWQEELNDKFNEHFLIINRAMVRQYGGKNPFIEHDLCLASIYWAAREDVKVLAQEADFDLIIVDEAHKMAAYTHGTIKKKTSKTKLYHLGESILRKVPHCVLLTATPHKGDVENFRHLMKLIDQDIFSSTTVNETLKEKSNPFIIRRLKENLTNFDGTPLFPKRITKTLQFDLSERELQLYEAVTDYVRNHFNRAMGNGSNSTAFAMMLLQRRLSSSTEAIHLSLQRRKERLEILLQETEQERKRIINKLQKLEVDDFEDEGYDEQQRLEDSLEQAVDLIDTEELKIEIQELDKLIQQTSYIRLNMLERKYDELERTLFASNGLLDKQEKILIFTESTDTLKYLERRLKERVPAIAKIVGKYSMDERRRQVELFRNECQVMLATDAGGESINLQFCNQMINYDIPWNPNKLEQRMGRIHRIGQKNEVAIFNLVAANTREGDVMIRLLDKMERMREDLGSDSVYDFIGEILDDEYGNLANLMEAAILNRENLDDIIATMDKRISEEHQRLLKFFENERVADQTFDLPTMRREQHDKSVESLPKRVYTPFAEYIFKKNNIRVYDSFENMVKRVDRFPKFIRETSRKLNLGLGNISDSIKFTGYIEYESEDVVRLNEVHELVKLAMYLTKKEVEQQSVKRYSVSYPVGEPISVNVYSTIITDGTGTELAKDILFLAERENGDVIQLDPYWLFQSFSGTVMQFENKTFSNIQSEAVKATIQLRNNVKIKRELQLNKVADYLHKTFKKQIDDIIDKRYLYEQDNIDNKNSALINQMNANLIDTEMRRDERLLLIERQRNIGMEPPKLLMQIELTPNHQRSRVFTNNYKEIIEHYEKDNGRGNIKKFNSFALVDFYSERFNGEPRFIIITHQDDYFPSKEHLEDIREIAEKVFIYVIKNNEVVKERKLAEEIFIF
jgi:superfamily II DNA or RNA helicase